MVFLEILAVLAGHLHSTQSQPKLSRSVADLFDSHDDRDDDGEAGSVEEHKSVIMHLLSQVRLGMDLTKVRASVHSLRSCVD